MSSIQQVNRSNSTLLSIKSSFSNATLKVYETYIYSIKAFVDLMTRRNFRAFGATVGMLFSELPAVVRSTIYTFAYKTPPLANGSRIPVLLFHGAAGSCNYLHDLAEYLEKRNYDVYVINLGTRELTNEMRRTVYERIDGIRNKYNENTPLNLVAHSLGGYAALSSIFTESSTTIKDGQVQLLDKPQANPAIGKLITLAMPYNRAELNTIEQIGKTQDVYNITAKYDVLMGNKVCAVTGAQFVEVNAGHIGIVFEKAAFNEVHRILSN